MENYFLTHGNLALLYHDFIRIKEDYQRMAEYWQGGYEDPDMEIVYGLLLRRAYELVSDITFQWMLSESSFLSALYSGTSSHYSDYWSMIAVREKLESFVSDVAMLDLEPAANRQQKRDSLYSAHFELMRELFNHTAVSPQWTESLADSYLELLLSPTVASIDQQLIASAIALSATQHFCYQKFRVLTSLYKETSDEPLRQRALVGWVMAAYAPGANLYAEMGKDIAEMCKDDKTCQELAELQMQLFFCLHADADKDTIQKEILPEIMNGSNIKLTHGGLVETEEDSLEEILHPEASELAMERMEQSMQRMVDMQKQGADIYFGGFSQMKRFSFFSDICNWFVPFYPQHPGISKTWNNTRGKSFLKAITSLGAFCNSDKYSFVLAFSMVLDRLPKSMLKMIENGEATAMPIGGEVLKEEQERPAFVRRTYLQDLYRFYRLFPTRGEFLSPFEEKDKLLFFANELFAHDSMATHAAAVARFLMKRKLYDEAASVLLNIAENNRDLQYYLLMGAALQHASRSYELTAIGCFEKAYSLDSSNERAMSGLARQLFVSEQYDKALSMYEKLLEAKPQHRQYMLNAAVCMVNSGRSQDALKYLHQLNYLDADDKGVLRVMAWAYTIDGQYDSAVKLFKKLEEATPQQPSDLLNYGYCLWLSHKVKEAIGMFRRFYSTQENFDMEKEFMHGTEHKLLLSKGIGLADINLMVEAVTQ